MLIKQTFVFLEIILHVHLENLPEIPFFFFFDVGFLFVSCDVTMLDMASAVWSVAAKKVEIICCCGFSCPLYAIMLLKFNNLMHRESGTFILFSLESTKKKKKGKSWRTFRKSDNVRTEKNGNQPKLIIFSADILTDEPITKGFSC